MEDIKMKRNPIFLSVIFLSALPVPFCGFVALDSSRLCGLMGLGSTAWADLGPTTRRCPPGSSQLEVARQFLAALGHVEAFHRAGAEQFHQPLVRLAAHSPQFNHPRLIR